MSRTIEQIRSDFPILAERIGKHPLVYLDNAATAQKPECVIDTVNRLHRHQNGNIHRGIHSMAEQTTLQYEQAREKIRQYIGAENTTEIVFTSGATASINLVAHSFGERYITPGDNIIISEMEHHSNIVPWQLAAMRHGAEIRVIPFDDDGRLDIEQLSRLIDSKTRIVAITQISNVLGTNPDLRKVIDTAHAAGVPVMVDGCQGIVHMPIDVAALGCDFYAFSGHKLYGPTGIGVLYGQQKWLEELPPYMGGGDMIATVSLPQGTTYAALPLKFEAGTSNYIGAIGLGVAIDYIQQQDPVSIHRHEQTLLELATAQLGTIPGLRIYGTTPDKAPIISFTIDGTHPLDIGTIVDKLGVAIRTGTHCAEPIMKHYGTHSMCRLSIGMYNTEQEIEIAAQAIERAAGMLR